MRIILNALVNSHQIQGFDELEEALGEAVGVYNGDVNELGVSPSQTALGRQPRMSGEFQEMSLAISPNIWGNMGWWTRARPLLDGLL